MIDQVQWGIIVHDRVGKKINCCWFVYITTGRVSKASRLASSIPKLHLYT